MPRFVNEEVANEETTDKLSTTSEILLLVLPLLLVYISNQWSRFSISYLVEFPIERNAHVSMNADIGFTEAQYGILASTAFTILFAISSLFAGNLADKYDRKILTLISCTVWTLATFSQSIAHSYEEVLIARFLMGGACAFAAPCAYSLIADRVSEERAALANSIYSSGVYLGGALASLSLLIDDMIGWRDTMALNGWYGLLSVVISSFTLPFEQARSNTKNCHNVKDSSSLTRDVIEILSNPQVQYLLLASFFRFSAGLIIAIWAPSYYKQAFPNNSSEYAVLNALIKGGIGMASGISGGYLAGFLKQVYRKDSSEGRTSIVNKYFDEDTVLLLVPILSSLLAIPTWYLTTHTPQGKTAFELSMFWLAVEYLVAECWFGPTIAVLQSSVEPSIRGTSQGLFVLVGALGNVSPSLLGWVYGNKTQFPLADLLGVSVCGGYLMSSLFFVASVGRKGK
jgi:MFS family permease